MVADDASAAKGRSDEGRSDGPARSATRAGRDPWLWVGVIAWLAMMAFFFYLRDVKRAPESTLHQDAPGATEPGDSSPR